MAMAAAVTIKTGRFSLYAYQRLSKALLSSFLPPPPSARCVRGEGRSFSPNTTQNKHQVYRYSRDPPPGCAAEPGKIGADSGTNCRTATKRRFQEVKGIDESTDEYESEPDSPRSQSTQKPWIAEEKYAYYEDDGESVLGSESDGDNGNNGDDSDERMARSNKRFENPAVSKSPFYMESDGGKAPHFRKEFGKLIAELNRAIFALPGANGNSGAKNLDAFKNRDEAEFDSTSTDAYPTTVQTLCGMPKMLDSDEFAEFLPRLP
ncbi:uncharacterized protein DSM5745_01141 [Aspergillus mulundensis]|uniref:Uncharacterized protein n=1 Tax=Aspergillus mulundensis TaxID=1810919 RepID=A0A3D8T5L1_9EURO|nr:hypothetical protein DSM5745_01141 [Aspergillus mulundensis]RDW93819.1 hypothetical protein DSM5745_01141 [Aspergillus mulundensis]